GVVGLSTAIAAAKSGASRVAVMDPLAAGNDVWASGDETRLFRLSYFEHPSYVPLLRRAIEGWKSLGPDLLVQCGNLYGGALDSPLVAGSLAAAREQDLTFDLLTPSVVAERYPQFAIADDEVGYFEAEGGFLRAREATMALAAAATALGVTWLHENVTAVEPVGDRWSVGSHTASQVIVAAGHHTSSLVMALSPFLSSREHFVFWLDSLVSTEGGPGFGFMNGAGEMLYGFPSQSVGQGIKVGGHCDVADGTYEDQLATITELTSRFLPGAGKTVLRSRSCFYDNSPDGNFIIGQIEPGLSVACGFSGHGYKFGSVIGDVVWQAANAGFPKDLSFLNVARYLG
ncbi:MAG TPA: FAD-dependent oxidoreductase, partial [Fimbriimonas sp.]|nr:FAD-dependent oxidoreductase [Fimbriimonas sp.]